MTALSRILSAPVLKFIFIFELLKNNVLWLNILYQNTFPMSNRRKFLLQTSFAATAFMVAKPYNALARVSSQLTAGSFNYNHITFLHTANTGLDVAAQVKKISSKNPSVVLVHAGNEKDQNAPSLKYDASPASLSAETENGYKIIYKDNIKVGVIAAELNENGVINKVNNLSAFLKEEKKCQLVVCISQLGFKNKNTVDDITLAAKSEHLDIIVGQYAPTSPKRPFIALNKKKAEVVIQHTQDNDQSLGKIKIGFNQAGSKYNISF
jgi:hypothetical protein